MVNGRGQIPTCWGTGPGDISISPWINSNNVNVELDEVSSSPRQLSPLRDDHVRLD